MKNKKKKPTLAPGMNDHEELEERATQEEQKKGETTPVVHLSYDETGPSLDSHLKRG